MTLQKMTSWLQRAQQEGFAVGAFNANTMEQVQAIVAAAEAEMAPVIIQVSHNALRYVGDGDVMRGMAMMATIGKTAAEGVRAPVSLHLDHASEQEVLAALEHGFTSVMFDGADLPFAENVAVTRRLREAAHAAGVAIEAEVGEVPRVGDGNLEPALTDPQEAATFVQETGVDALAVAIGSVHALKEKRVQLDLKRLAAIRARVDVPLVLHGSSGVTDEHLLLGIRQGLAKVNIATRLNRAFTEAVRTALAEDTQLVDPRTYLAPARAEMEQAVRALIRMLGSAGKAAQGEVT